MYYMCYMDVYYTYVMIWLGNISNIFMWLVTFCWHKTKEMSNWTISLELVCIQRLATFICRCIANVIRSRGTYTIYVFHCHKQFSSEGCEQFYDDELHVRQEIIRSAPYFNLCEQLWKVNYVEKPIKWLWIGFMSEERSSPHEHI